jgi:PhnB protein
MAMTDAFESLLRPNWPENPPPRLVIELYLRLQTEVAAVRQPSQGWRDVVDTESHPVAPATPCLVVRGAARAISFYEEVFGAVELPGRLTTSEGAIAHMEFAIGTSRFALADEDPQWNRSPHALGGSAVPIALNVGDADAVFDRAVAAGARVIIPVADQDHGHRAGRLADPFGHLWIIFTPLASVS